MLFKRFLLVVTFLMMMGAISACQRNEIVQTETIAVNVSVTVTPFMPTVTNTPTRTPTPTHTPHPTVTPTPEPLRAAAVGDISICGQEGDDLTAALLPDDLDMVLLLGDANNEDGTLWQYENCFSPSWRNFMDRVFPAPGNHDYYSDPMQGYFAFFGERAGIAGKGYYASQVGDWQIISLNTNCAYVPCGPTSEQAIWLTELLTQPQPLCTLAIWHHPRWTSGLAGETHWIATFWDLLYEAGADLALSGHDHHYERISPLDNKGVVNEEFGIRSFVVGTGGASSRGLAEIKPYSEERVVGEFGVLFLTLFPKNYMWQFVNIDGEVLDEGSGVCHP